MAGFLYFFFGIILFIVGIFALMINMYLSWLFFGVGVILMVVGFAKGDK